jgi:hypothetical protein
LHNQASQRNSVTPLDSHRELDALVATVGRAPIIMVGALLLFVLPSDGELSCIFDASRGAHIPLPYKCIHRTLLIVVT